MTNYAYNNKKKVAIVLAVILIYCVDKGWTVLGYSLGVLFSLGVLAYLFLTKKPWLYCFSVIFISITLLVIGLLGVDI